MTYVRARVAGGGSSSSSSSLPNAGEWVGCISCSDCPRQSSARNGCPTPQCSPVCEQAALCDPQQLCARHALSLWHPRVVETQRTQFPCARPRRRELRAEAGWLEPRWGDEREKLPLTGGHRGFRQVPCRSPLPISRERLTYLARVGQEFVASKTCDGCEQSRRLTPRGPRRIIASMGIAISP